MMKKNTLIRLLSCLLSVLFLLPAAVLAESDADVLDITEIDLDTEGKDWSVSDYVFPLDLDYKSNPEAKKDGFTDSKDENGKPVYVYEDSTIRVVVSEIRYFLPGGRDTKGTDIWMADIVISDPSQMRTISAGGPFDLKKKSTNKHGVDMAAKVRAVTALSGDSWGASEKHGYGVIVRQGELIDCKLDDSGKYVMDVLLIDVNGDFHVIHAAKDGDLENPLEYEGKQIIQGFSFGPVLVENGEAVTVFRAALPALSSVTLKKAPKTEQKSRFVREGSVLTTPYYTVTLDENGAMRASSDASASNSIENSFFNRIKKKTPIRAQKPR